MKFNAKQMLVSAALISTLSLVGCGGGGGSSSSSGSDASSTNTNQSSTTTQAAELQQGQFVDSAVSGLWFETETQSGFTDANGFFSFLAGESVSFYLGDTLLGTVVPFGKG